MRNSFYLCKALIGEPKSIETSHDSCMSLFIVLEHEQ